MLGILLSTIKWMNLTTENSNTTTKWRAPYIVHYIRDGERFRTQLVYAIGCLPSLPCRHCVKPPNSSPRGKASLVIGSCKNVSKLERNVWLFSRPLCRANSNDGRMGGATQSSDRATLRAWSHVSRPDRYGFGFLTVVMSFLYHWFGNASSTWLKLFEPSRTTNDVDSCLGHKLPFTYLLVPYYLFLRIIINKGCRHRSCY